MHPEPEVPVTLAKLPTAARSEIYCVLSRVFIYPGDEAARRFVLTDAASDMSDLAAALPYPLALPAQPAACSGTTLTELQRAHTALFDNCSGRVKLSPYEKEHRDVDPKEIWEDLIRYYEHFGLTYELSANGEWPDWLGMELEFMHYLSFLEAAAKDGQEDSYVAAQADFLERHLALWIPTFAQKLESLAPGTPYAWHAAALDRFISNDTHFSRERRPDLSSDRSGRVG